MPQFPQPAVSRKRKKPGDLGCNGAYFMPTMATHTMAVNRLTKAAFVDTHVSSLRPSEVTSGSGGSGNGTFMLVCLVEWQNWLIA